MMQQTSIPFFQDLQKFLSAAFQEIFQQFRGAVCTKEILSNVQRGRKTAFTGGLWDVEFAGKVSPFTNRYPDVCDQFSFEKTSFAKSHEMMLEMFLYGICS